MRGQYRGRARLLWYAGTLGVAYVVGSILGHPTPALVGAGVAGLWVFMP